MFGENRKSGEEKYQDRQLKRLREGLNKKE